MLTASSTHWIIPQVDLNEVNTLAKELSCSPLFARLLINRGVCARQDARAFLGGTIEDLPDPCDLPDMDRAVERLRRAVAQGERIRVWGDYDADGLCGTALLVRALRSLGADVGSHVPHRLLDGYGLTLQGARTVVEDKIDVLVTIDSGTTAVAPVEWLLTRGVDVIVVDHHEPRGERMAPAHALINPKRHDRPYADRHLTASGLAWKVAHAVHAAAGRPAPRELLAFAGIGTVCDMADLLGENRALLKAAFAECVKTPFPGIKAFFQSTTGRVSRPSAWKMGFDIGPRLNAAGRLGAATSALALLLTDSPDEVSALLSELNSTNRTRQRLQQRMLADALRRVEQEVNFAEHHVIVLASKEWHPGVVGVVAGRLSERFNRPVVLCAQEGDMLRGSGRSPGALSLVDGLTHCHELLMQYGGHRNACGLTMEERHFAAFRERLNDHVRTRLPEMFEDVKEWIDAQITLDQLTPEALRDMRALAPHGRGNPRPRFVSEGVEVFRAFSPYGRTVSGPAKSVRGWVRQGNTVCEMVTSAQRAALQRLTPGTRIDLVYTPSVRAVDGYHAITLQASDVVVREA